VEVASGGVLEVEAAHARSRQHRAMLGEVDAELLRTEQVEDTSFECVVRTCRIAERRTTPAVPLADQLLARERLLGCIPGPSDLAVQPFRGGLHPDGEQRS